MEDKDKIDNLINDLDVHYFLEWHGLYYIELESKKFDSMEDKEFRRLENSVIRVQRKAYEVETETHKVLPQLYFKDVKSAFSEFNIGYFSELDEETHILENEPIKESIIIKNILNRWKTDIDLTVLEKISKYELILFNKYTDNGRLLARKIGKNLALIVVIQACNEYLNDLKTTPSVLPIEKAEIKPIEWMGTRENLTFLISQLIEQKYLTGNITDILETLKTVWSVKGEPITANIKTLLNSNSDNTSKPRDKTKITNIVKSVPIK